MFGIKSALGRRVRLQMVKIVKMVEIAIPGQGVIKMLNLRDLLPCSDTHALYVCCL